MNLLGSIEASALAEYVRVAPYGYAAMITLHSLGLAIMVGVSVILSLRVLGVFDGLPFESLGKLFSIAWLGFIVNLLSGSALFASQATTYVTDFEFLIKMLFVILGAVFVALLQSVVGRAAPAGAADTDGRLRHFYAGAAIGSWAGAMIAGRLIAYL